jgi:hypothetical protein
MKLRKSSKPKISPPEKLQSTIQDILSQLLCLEDHKEQTLLKYSQKESKMLKTLQTGLEQEKFKTKSRTDFSCSPLMKKSAEEIAGKEKKIEELSKSNKAMKTLLAEMTLSIVDNKLSTSYEKHLKSEILSISGFIHKYSKSAKELSDSLKPFPLKRFPKTRAYHLQVSETVEQVLQKDENDWKSLASCLCNKILNEQANRLKAEEVADKRIHEKNSEINRLEELLRVDKRLTGSFSQ